MRKAMRYSISVLVFICLVLSISFVSSAHSGRTDSAGGHYDRSTGEYHYHHGYSAHQHPNGVCPYAKNTTKSSSVTETKDSSVKDTGFSLANIEKIFSDIGRFLFLGLISLGLAAYVYNSFTNKDKKEANKHIDSLNFQLREKSDENNNLAEQVKHSHILIQKYETDIQDLKEQLKTAAQEIKECKEKNLNRALSLESLTENEIRSICGVPDSVTFDEELLPHCLDNRLVERHFSVYITSSGRFYHRLHGCCGAEHKVHLFVAAGNFQPCHKCIPKAAWKYEIPDWYYRYVQLENRKFGGSKVKPHPPDFF